MEIKTIVLPSPGGYNHLDGAPPQAFYIADLRLLIDTGFDTPDSIDLLLRHAEGAETVILTHHHADHVGGATAVARRHGARLIAPHPPSLLHPAEAAAEAQLPPGIRIIPTPGHTMDHISVVIDEMDAAFVGDTLLGEGTPWVGPPDGEIPAYLRTLQEMIDGLSETLRLYPGHGPAGGSLHKRLRWTLDHRLQRERQIVQALDAGAKSVEALVRLIYVEGEGMKLSGMHEMLAHLTVQGHIQKLLDENKIAAGETGLWRLL